MKQIKIIVITVVLLVILIMPVMAQNSGQQSLTQMIDGHVWSQMSEDSKTFYLAGYVSSMRYTRAFVTFLQQEGVFTEAEIAKLQKYINEWTDYHYQIGYLMKKITEYYNETGKWGTPLSRVVLIVTKNRGSQILDRLEEKKSSNGKDNV